MLMVQDTGEACSTPDRQPKQSTTKFDPSVSIFLLFLDQNLPNPDQHGISSSTRKRVESHDRYVGVVKSDDDEFYTIARPAKRARFIEPTKWGLENEFPANYDRASQQPEPQHPALQHSSTQHPAPSRTSQHNTGTRL